MQVLRKWAWVGEFPQAPRSIRYRPSVWIAFGSVLTVLCVVLAIVWPITQSNIQNATQLLASASRGTARITSKAADRSQRNIRYYVAYRSVEQDTVSGRAYLSLERWDEFEVGQVVSVWYLPNNHTVNRITPPSLHHVSRAKQSQVMVLLAVFASAAIASLCFGVAVSREKKLAILGHAIIGDYTLLTSSAAGRTEYKNIWTFEDSKGVPRTYTHRSYRSNVLPHIVEGAVTLLVDPKSPSLFKAWELFRWVDILVDA